MIQKCRIGGDDLEPVIDLGDLYVSGFYPEPLAEAPRGRLQIGIGKSSGLLQLMDSVDRPSLYEKYWYRSGTNETMRSQLSDVLRTVALWRRLDDGDVVLDIGCNDGTLLDLYAGMRPLFRIGIDPAKNLAEEASKRCERHATGFFKRDLFYKQSGGRKAKVITTIAMFYGLEDPSAFVADLRDCLADDGIWVLQLSYTPLMLKQNAFDNICHEHLQYYTLKSLCNLLQLHDLKVVDVEFNDTNSGSFRLVITHSSNPVSHAPLFIRDLGGFRVESTLEYEDHHAFDDPSIYKDYMKRLEALKSETNELFADIVRSGKVVCGYGASTKGNTLLQYYGITPETMPCIAERQVQKVGLFTAGSWIPIVDEATVRKMKPDYLFLLPWHFLEEFRTRESAFLAGGGKFIVPLPRLEVIG